MNIPPTAAPSIQVIRATGTDWPMLAEFYARQFTERPRLNDARIWRWQFLEQPGDARPVPFFVLKVDECIEGAIGYLQFDLRVGDASLTAIHPVNYFVNPHYKGLSALRLLRAILQEGHIIIGSYVSDDARRLLSKSGFIDFGAYVNSYHLGLRMPAVQALQGESRMTPRTNPISRLIWAGRRAWESALRGYIQTKDPSLTYRMDVELNDALLEIAGTWLPPGVGIYKTSEYLRWRYAHSPVLTCRYLWQFDNGIPVSLAVLHFDADKRAAVMLDLTAATFASDRCTGIILEIIRQARANALNLFTTHCMSPGVEAILCRIGCGCVTSDLGFMMYSPDTESKKILADAKHWHFMTGDTDRY